MVFRSGTCSTNVVSGGSAAGCTSGTVCTLASCNLHMLRVLPTTDAARAVVRHLVATLAYRAAKVLRDVPPEFASATVGPATRRPVQIVAHLGDLMAWAITLARGESVWKAGGGDDWNVEVDRFFDGLSALDRELAGDASFTGSIEKLIRDRLPMHSPTSDSSPCSAA